MRPPNVVDQVLEVGGEVISWIEYDRRRLDDLRRRFDEGQAWRQPHLRALTLLKQARDELADTPFKDALSPLEETISLIPVVARCGRTAEMLWLGTAHLVYRTDELADMLGVAPDVAIKRISGLHAHYREALGRDERCPCGHPFGYPLISCHS